MSQPTYIARKGEDADFAALSADSLTLSGAAVVTALLLASGQVVDLNGEADALIMDAAQNVRLDGSSVGKLRFKISGAYDFEVLANIFRALSGSVIETNTINETTAASGVTIDGVLLKDSAVTASGGVTADLTGNVAGGVALPVQVMSADAAVTIRNGVVVVTKAGVAAMTLAAPTAGTDDGKILYIDSLTAQAHTLTVTGGLRGAGAGEDVGTFGGAIGDGVTLYAYNGAWYPIRNTNVTFA